MTVGAATKLSRRESALSPELGEGSRDGAPTLGSVFEHLINGNGIKSSQQSSLFFLSKNTNIQVE